MAVQAISSEDLFGGLPPVIGLPRCLPNRPAYPKTPLGEVLVPDELPPYLLLGTLDRSTFQCSETGWSARWIGDVPETYVDAKYDRGERRLDLRQVWRGIDGGYSTTTADDFGHAIQSLYLRFPETWDTAMAKRLEASYRLKYAAQQADEIGFTGIPDGGFKTICVPVPVRHLAELHQCFEDMSGDPRLKTPRLGGSSSGSAPSTTSWGRARRGRRIPGDCSPLRSTPAVSCRSDCRQLEHGKDGSSAWTVRRLIYLASIGVPFAGVEFVVERLAERGLIKTASS